jgi:hypothetical protein
MFSNSIENHTEHWRRLYARWLDGEATVPALRKHKIKLGRKEVCLSASRDGGYKEEPRGWWALPMGGMGWKFQQTKNFLCGEP